MTTTTRISDRDCDVLYDVTRFQLVSTEQIRQLRFSHLDRDSQAARMLLHRLKANGLLAMTKTYARSTRDGDGLCVTKPVPVWYLPPSCQRRIRDTLSQRGSGKKFERFEKHTKCFNSAASFSDMCMAHELGLTQILMAIDRAATTTPEIVDAFWMRTSPRHKLTASKVLIGQKPATINPDAVFFFRWKHKDRTYPFFFYIEYERGTARPSQYRKAKLEPYDLYATSSSSNRLFSEVLGDLVEMHGVAGVCANQLTFRVLTVAETPTHTKMLRSEASALRTPTRFLFSSITDATADALGPHWIAGGGADGQRLP